MPGRNHVIELVVRVASVSILDACRQIGESRPLLPLLSLLSKRRSNKFRRRIPPGKEWPGDVIEMQSTGVIFAAGRPINSGVVGETSRREYARSGLAMHRRV